MRYIIYDVMGGLRDLWSRLNQAEFMDLFFFDVFDLNEGWLGDRKNWDNPDPDNYYENKWDLFRKCPVLFWASCDDGRRVIMNRAIAQQVQKAQQHRDKVLKESLGINEEE